MAVKKRSAKRKKSILLDGTWAPFFAFFGIFMLVISILALIYTSNTLHTYNVLTQTGGRSEGIVVRLQYHSTRHSSSENPVAVFKADGKTITHEFNNVKTTIGYWNVGDTFPVAYDKKNPNHAIVIGPEALKRQNFDHVTMIVFFFITGGFFVSWILSVLGNIYRKTHPKPKKSRKRKATSTKRPKKTITAAKKTEDN